MATDLLLSYFDESRFVPALRARSKKGVIKELAGALSVDPDIRHPDILLEALTSRESLGSTGIGKEVAIPHSRTLSVPRLKVLLARSKKGVDWESPDQKAVRLFFLVVAPPQEKNNVYLPLLGSLVSAMQDTKSRDAILGAKNFDDAMAALREAFRG
ncbi:MAG: PTS sugar transporter subunit IIA [Gemmatimonadota bacterium]|nr:PTS sugar transporter subunit IIA [Gemmatimonadota bacterium]